MHRNINLNGSWKYHRGAVSNGTSLNCDDSGWSWVNLPHNTSLYTAENKNAYEGISCYRKRFCIDENVAGKRLLLKFEGVMQHCSVYLNGELVAVHHNGYTPFFIEISQKVRTVGENLLAVITDSSPDPEYTPGKQNPDFQYFGGIYRNVTLDITDDIYITNAVVEDITAGGGVFLTTPSVSSDSADIRARTCVRNSSATAQEITLKTELVYDGETVVSAESSVSVEAGTAHTFDELLTISEPRLWHPYTPELYTVKSTVISDGKAVDEAETTYGIRRIEWTHDGLFINGGRFMAQGANLHSDIFVLGNAIPDNEVFEEIRRLKENGLDFIRMAHYPHSNAYYDACDKYGVLVLDCMSGWQNFNNSDTFKESTYQELRTMIRNSRNHPCIAAWETSLNESNFTEEWARNVQRIAHEEYPSEGASRMWTTGWMTDVFDIYLGAAQHDVRNKADSSEKGVIISEYGDWDYGGTASTSRQAREWGDNAMLTQVANHIESAILNRDKSWFAADGLWSYNDYAGFDSGMTCCGVTDMYRIDKYTAQFFRSQRDADVDLSAYGLKSGAMVFVANSLTDDSPADVTVFSNCDEVELSADGVSVGRQTADTEYYGPNSGRMLSTENLPHAPITFTGANSSAAELKAVGYINGTAVCEHIVKAPEAAEKIVLVSESATPITANGSDVKLVWVRLTDKNGTVAVKDDRLVSLSAENGYVIGGESVNTNGGQIGVWVRAKASEADGTVKLTASAEDLSDGVLEIPFTGCAYAADCDKAVNEYAVETYLHATLLYDRAREKHAYSSSCADGCTADYGNNGEPSTFWYPACTDENIWWYVDTGSVYDFGRIEICWDSSDTHRFSIELSDDGRDWREVIDMSSATKVESQSVISVSGSGRYVRISFAENNGHGFNMFCAYGK